MVRSESIAKLREVKADKERLESGFNDIGLASQSEPVDVSERCSWVLASVYHDVRNSPFGD